MASIKNDAEWIASVLEFLFYIVETTMLWMTHNTQELVQIRIFSSVMFQSLNLLLVAHSATQYISISVRPSVTLSKIEAILCEGSIQ